MNTRPDICPLCSKPFHRPIAIIMGREALADARVICRDCSAKSGGEIKQEATQAWRAMLAEHLPATYRAADPARIPERYRPAMQWAPVRHPWGVGLIGPAGQGKSMTAACLVKAMHRPFRWVASTKARSLYNAAATADKEDKGYCRSIWERLSGVYVLVLDDLSQGSFTPAWGAALFGLLEERTGRGLPTMWTSQIPLRELAAKIENGTGDGSQAEAITRRLGQHSLVIA